MLHQFIKSWIAVTLIATTPIFTKEKETSKSGSLYDQGHEVSTVEMMAAYNAPACIKLQNDTWDIYTTGSFIYWQASQENMEIGLITKNASETVDPFLESYVNNITVTSPNFTFRPGFKLGLGANLNWNSWDAYAEYTWFHGSIASGVRPLPQSTATTVPFNGEYLYPMLQLPTAQYFRNANQSWSLRMDFVDISLARSSYLGTKLTVRSFFGVRGAWIRQNLTTTYNGSTNYTNVFGYTDLFESNYTASWGVGPRLGLESNWMVGRGFRFIGNGAGDLLYTRYRIHLVEQLHNINTIAGTINPITENYSPSQEIDYLRAHLDLEIGFGWGTYFYRNSYHIDLSATYGFQVFWNQNMFRNFTDQFTPGQSFAPNGNLYVQGLTANARFDF